MKNAINKIRKADETSRAQNFVTKSNELSKTVKNAVSNSIYRNGKFYPKSWVGSGRHISLRDNSFYIIELLKRLGYKYTLGNDAPKGGKEGDYIKCSTTARNAIYELLK